MFGIFITAVVGAAATYIIGKLNEAASDQYNRWESKKEEVSREIDYHNRTLKTHMDSAWATYSFHELKAARTRSIQTADKAYILLEDARQSLEVFGQGLVALKAKMNTCFESKKNAMTPAEKRQYTQEFYELKALRQTLFEKQAQLKAEKQALYQKVKALNYQTHQLKLALQERRDAFESNKKRVQKKSTLSRSDFIRKKLTKSSLYR